MKRKHYFAIDLVDKLKTTYHIFCNKCDAQNSIYNLDEYISAVLFFNEGWRKTKHGDIRCPKCASKLSDKNKVQ